MKKSLLLATALMMGASAFAETEGVTYPNKEGYTFTNLWVNCNAKGEWKSYAENQIPSMDYVATATGSASEAIVASSKSFGVNDKGETGLVDQGQLVIFDINTGAYLRNVALTIDGQPLTGLLCANHIGTDDYNNVYLFGYKASTWNDTKNEPNPLNIYLVDTNTGALTLIAAPALDEDFRHMNGRVDHIDVVGDITRQQAGCVVMAAPSAPADKRYLYAWACEQGSDEFYGHLAGGSYIGLEISECFPAAEGPWGGGAFVGILRDEEHSGTLAYIDAMNYLPALYGNEGEMVSSFADVEDPDKEIIPHANPNGAFEFTVGDNTFLMYPYEEYDPAPNANRARIVKYGTVGDMSTITKMYDFPQIGMGVHKGAGRRTHILQANVVTDDAGKQGAYILSYKTGNGLARFLLAEEGFNGGAGVSDIVVEDENAPVEYFNLQGIRVANPENGVFIRRQGSSVSKVVL